MRGGLSVVPPALHDFRDNKSLQHHSAHCPCLKRLWRIPAGKVAGKAGVHEIHLRALDEALLQSSAAGLKQKNHSPKEVVTGRPVPQLTTAEDRCRIIRQLFPIDTVIVAPFDREMMTMGWEDFLELLRARFHARWLVAGHDYRFGHRNEGTPQRLRQWAGERGIGCDIIPAVTLEGRTVSSTWIRALLEEGRREEARRYLGHDLLRLPGGAGSQ